MNLEPCTLQAKKYSPLKKDLQSVLQGLDEWCGNHTVVSGDTKG